MRPRWITLTCIFVILHINRVKYLNWPEVNQVAIFTSVAEDVQHRTTVN